MEEKGGEVPAAGKKRKRVADKGEADSASVDGNKSQKVLDTASIFTLGIPSTLADQDPETVYKMGVVYQECLPDVGFVYFRIAAEKGHPLALLNMGLASHFGIGGDPDDVKAMEWYLKSAAQGNKDALHNIGIMYFEGEGVEPDEEKGTEYLRLAAEKGQADSCRKLSSYYRNKDDRKAFEYAKLAVEYGSVGYCNLALFYVHGVGVEKDERKGAELMRVAADRGDPSAQFNLGAMYHQGIGVEQDFKKGMDYYLLAADKGNLDAFVNMGGMYRDGQGVDRDYKKAMEFFLRAAKEVWGSA